ncbi:hypothetical protein [Mycolicibacterium fluoranthenivorans]|uniref:DUF3291 domain-containing protein n=1 Tax=Mycolicibacterium fluoranthenivorans TaxID=258505 RepID=A0A7X5TZT0_9MYCO|nr:hypothetical protein [Mycolicibacterium fluoranthenivorans]MCV7358115.1 hypothetical protein [Mycolicibacterium fluoranthenivorans]NIH95765.1 hypothetical protein [Mycolicibacterium fluoranthenivorans]
MEEPNIAARLLATPVIVPWMPGPGASTTGPVVVSVTEIRAAHRRDVPGVAARGCRMRMGWYGMSGAVGLWLWSLPAALRGGSISVWEDEQSLQRFIDLPRHVDIMNSYRMRGTVRADRWSAERFEPGAVLERARDWIVEVVPCAG